MMQKPLLLGVLATLAFAPVLARADCPAGPAADAADCHAVNADYNDPGFWKDAPPDTLGREDWMAGRIRVWLDRGVLTRRQYESLMSDIDVIRRMDQHYRANNGGRLSPDASAEVHSRLVSIRERMIGLVNEDQNMGR